MCQTNWGAQCNYLNSSYCISATAVSLNSQWICSKLNLTNHSANKNICESGVINWQTAWLVSGLGLSRMHGIGTGYTAVMGFWSSTMSFEINWWTWLVACTNEAFDLLHVLMKQNAHKTMCGLRWHGHTEDITLVFKDSLACSPVIGWNWSSALYFIFQESVTCIFSSAQCQKRSVNFTKTE